MRLKRSSMVVNYTKLIISILFLFVFSAAEAGEGFFIHMNNKTNQILKTKVISKTCMHHLYLLDMKLPANSTLPRVYIEENDAGGCFFVFSDYTLDVINAAGQIFTKISYTSGAFGSGTTCCWGGAGNNNLPKECFNFDPTYISMTVSDSTQCHVWIHINTTK